MNWGSLPEILTAAGGFFVILGGAMRWIFLRIDKREEKRDKEQADARTKLETMFRDRISALEASVKTQGDEIMRLRTENSRYLRHVGILEGVMRAKGLEVPAMDLG